MIRFDDPIYDGPEPEKRVNAHDAKAGDLVDPTTLPDRIVANGGGWVGPRYFCTGAHKDGTSGWKCTEVR